MENGNGVGLPEFLVWVAGGGATVAASWILERMAWYTDLASEIKRWIFFGIAALIGVAAYVIGTYVPVATLEQLAPYFMVLSSAFSYVFLGSAFHKVDRIPEE